MIQRIKNYIEEHHMLNDKDKVIVGISGGADSVCLFFVLLALKERYHLSLVAVHINHGIRGEDATQDAEFVKNLCMRYEVPYRLLFYPVKKLAKEEKVSEEEMGRKVRYEAFQRVLVEERGQKIAVAHNQNDQSETVLMHLFRGSGLKGLTGILPVRNQIIRPLLLIERKEIEAYLEEHNLSYRTDQTNQEEIYTRNKIRLSILPCIEKQINKSAGKQIAKAAGMLREVEEYIEKNGLLEKEKIVTKQNGKYSFKVNMFLEEDIVIQKQIIRLLLEEITSHLKDIEAEHIKMICSLCKKQVGKEMHLPYGIVAKRMYQEVELYVRETDFATKKMETTTVEGEKIPDLHFEVCPINMIKNSEFPKNDYTKWFDYDKIISIATLRHRQMGDYFQIDDQGGLKKINRYFIDKKIPKEKRDSIFLLADGSHIIWIIGDRISEAYKIGENTKNILIVNINGGI